ncbi:hypothetical protein NQ314_017647 [Rhamnusium bicolor]|uniref:Retrotransposon gag domain-containing protein n=1 Tax=Rhamnusium bicolor TaxID=1586634 RepID=A0AAV8WT97_9CUCU|nr:hypothetical protein NQ314_017647 [Rhamnusium bicolor]
MGSDMVKPFDPEDRFVNVDRWLSTIDQLSEVHGWSEYEKSYFMQIKLRGSARAWFNKLDDFSCSWCEWKAKLRQAFPRQNDFAISLEELVVRRKLSTEKMTIYYHAKFALCSQCGVVGDKAVLCIIRGLPEELQANAYACRCATPEALYSEFLAGLGYQIPVAAGSSKRGDRVSTGSGSRRSGNTLPSSERRAATLRKENLWCFNC